MNEKAIQDKVSGRRESNPRLLLGRQASFCGKWAKTAFSALKNPNFSNRAKRRCVYGCVMLACLWPATISASTVVYEGERWNHDPFVMTVQGASTCQPQTECQLGIIVWPLVAQFANARYGCFASQLPGATIPAVIEFYPKTYAIVALQFFNFTPNPIPAGTVFNLAVTCYGLASSPPRR